MGHFSWKYLLTESEYGCVSHDETILVTSTKQDHVHTVRVDSECGSSITIHISELTSYLSLTPAAYTYKYSTLPRGIWIDIAHKVGIFPKAKGQGKYSLPRVQYVLIFHKEGLNIYFIT